MPNGRVCTGVRAGTSCFGVTRHTDGLCMIHLCLHLYARAALARLLTSNLQRQLCVCVRDYCSHLKESVHIWPFLLEIEGTVYPKMKMLSSLSLMLFHTYMLIFFSVNQY